MDIIPRPLGRHQNLGLALGFIPMITIICISKKKNQVQMVQGIKNAEDSLKSTRKKHHREINNKLKSAHNECKIVLF
jgi:hypothetical protein